MNRIGTASFDHRRQQAGMAVFAAGWVALMYEIARWVSAA